MRIRISEAIKTLKIKVDTLQKLYRKRASVAYVTYTEGSEPIEPEQTIQEVEAEISTLKAEIITLRAALAKANIETKNATGSNINKLLIELAQMKSDLNFYSKAESAEAKTRKTGYSGTTITEARFKIKTASKIAESLRKDIMETQMEIDTLNLTTYIEV